MESKCGYFATACKINNKYFPAFPLSAYTSGYFIITLIIKIILKG